MKGLLKGIHSGDGEGSTDLQERHKIVFSVLDDNESGEITLDELGKFLRELFKEQIKELQEGVEKQKYTRAADNAMGYDQSTNQWNNWFETSIFWLGVYHQTDN